MLVNLLVRGVAMQLARFRIPWNKDKLVGAKPPLRTKHVWSIRTKLQVDGRTRDLAMFNLAIDGKLRSCDVVSLNGRGSSLIAPLLALPRNGGHL